MTTVRQETISFDVRGLAVPQGSTKAYTPKGWSHPIITSAAKGLKAWRRLVADVAQRHAPKEPWNGPVDLTLRFRLPRPKSEPKTRRTWPDRRPDLDKLTRAIMDALAYVIFNDDGQVVHIDTSKDWGAPGVQIEVSRIAEVSDMARLAAEHTLRKLADAEAER